MGEKDTALSNLNNNITLREALPHRIFFNGGTNIKWGDFLQSPLRNISLRMLVIINQYF